MSEPGMDLEVIEDADYAPVQAGTLFGTDDPAGVIEKATSVANALASVIRSQNLATMIQGREHVRVEGWCLLGSMLGVFPVTVWTRQVGEDQGWEARVEVVTKDGSVVGAAESECLRSERTWKSRESYALRSMAATRATSKALRGPLGFVMTLAGFEATPEAEMPGVGDRVEAKEPAPRAKDYGEWLERMAAMTDLKPAVVEEWLAAAVKASGAEKAGMFDRLNRVMLWFADNPPVSSLDFYSVPELQAGWAVGFEGCVVDPPAAPEPLPPMTEDEIPFAPHLPLVEEEA